MSHFALLDNLRNRHGLSIKMMILFFVSIIVGLFFSFTVFFLTEWENCKNELRAVIDNRCESLAISLAYPLWSIDRTQLEKLLTAEMLNENIAGIAVRTLPAGDNYYIFREGGHLYFIQNGINLLSEEIRNSRFSCKKEIRFEGEPAGSVDIYSSDKLIREKMAGNIIQIIIHYSIIIPVIFFPLFFALGRMIILPIKRLSGALSSYTKGSFSIRVNNQSQDEIDELAVQFNKMADIIEDDMKKILSAQKLINNLNQDLENRVAERTAQLEIARERAESADRLKSAFLATMSHELRTPLNSIIGFSGILGQELAGPLNEEQKKQLGMLTKSSEHLLSLINDVLDISKIEAGQMSLSNSPFDLYESIENVMKILRPLAGKKGIELRLHLSEQKITVSGDRRRTEQILLNLLSNAIKFTEQGFVYLNCYLEENTVIMKIVDTGIGIALEDMEKIFVPFRQVNTGLARLYEGTGLGLSICKRLLEMMGGSVSAESERGKGSTFTVIMPVYALPH